MSLGTEEVSTARREMSVSIVLSGLRCALTYLVFPLLGPSAGITGWLTAPLTVVLGLLAVFFSVQSTRRFWGSRHRYRWAYTVFAVVIVAYVAFDFVRLAWLST